MLFEGLELSGAKRFFGIRGFPPHSKTASGILWILVPHVFFLFFLFFLFFFSFTKATRLVTAGPPCFVIFCN